MGSTPSTLRPISTLSTIPRRTSTSSTTSTSTQRTSFEPPETSPVKEEQLIQPPAPPVAKKAAGIINWIEEIHLRAQTQQRAWQDWEAGGVGIWEIQ